MIHIWHVSWACFLWVVLRPAECRSHVWKRRSLGGCSREMYLERWTAPVIRKEEYSKTERLESWKQKENRSEELIGKIHQNPACVLSKCAGAPSFGSVLYCLQLWLKDADKMLLLLLLNRFSRVRLCAAHQAPPSLGFSRQEHWSRLPFPSPMH